MNEEDDMPEDDDDREIDALDAHESEHAHDAEDALDPGLAARLEALPRTIEPQIDLWSGVAARIEAERARARVRRIRVRSALTVFAVAAALAIGLGVRALRKGATSAADARAGDAGRSPSSSVAASHSASPAIVSDPSVAPLLPEEPTYRAAALALRALLAESHAELGEETGDEVPSKHARRIDDDLRVIDAAIDATRAELAKSPDDQVLRDALRDAYQQEIDVLSDVIDLTSRT